MAHFHLGDGQVASATPLVLHCFAENAAERDAWVKAIRVGLGRDHAANRGGLWPAQEAEAIETSEEEEEGEVAEEEEEEEEFGWDNSE